MYNMKLNNNNKDGAYFDYALLPPLKVVHEDWEYPAWQARFGIDDDPMPW
jgi:hypothetical protein